MSTRAVYTFKDDSNIFHVYKHHDGYPSGAAQWIRKACEKAWQRDRFESCEFAAAFVAANKEGPGDVYLSSGYKDHGDLSYRYEISFVNETLHIVAFECTGYDEEDNQKYVEIFSGNLAGFEKFKQN